MRFLVEMNLPPALGGSLRAQGHDAIHVLEAGYATLPDREILLRAAIDDRIVVSFDLDFGDIAAVLRQSRPSVILPRLRLARQAYVRQRLQVAIGAGAIVLVEDFRIRIRHLPAQSQ